MIPGGKWEAACLLSVERLTSMDSLDCHCQTAGLMVLSPLYAGGDQYSEKKNMGWLVLHVNFMAWPWYPEIWPTTSLAVAVKVLF